MLRKKIKGLSTDTVHQEKQGTIWDLQVMMKMYKGMQRLFGEKRTQRKRVFFLF